jgi:hypothetical protein
MKALPLIGYGLASILMLIQPVMAQQPCTPEQDDADGIVVTIRTNIHAVPAVLTTSCTQALDPKSAWKVQTLIVTGASGSRGGAISPFTCTDGSTGQTQSPRCIATCLVLGDQEQCQYAYAELGKRQAGIVNASCGATAPPGGQTDTEVTCTWYK